MRILIYILVCFILGCKNPTKDQQNTYRLTQVATDSLFQSKQKIHLLSIDINSHYLIDLGYSDSILLRTSEIANNNNAVAAINGSFFDMKKGGSVTYLEKNDTVVSNTKKANSLINGIILLTKNGEIKIDTFKNDLFYENSENENFAISTGPILIKDSVLQPLINKKFTKNRHPRTCLCKKENEILFIVIDGRSANANGMSLFEAQEYLLGLNCKDAINLDGGGSSTMWVKDKGIVNNPSDRKGERAVSDALLLLGNE